MKLQRADKLIGGLGGEKLRWEATVAQMGHDLLNVVGDVVVASGGIAYAGPFTPTYRQQLNAEWVEELGRAGVPSSEGTNLIKTLQVRTAAAAVAPAVTTAATPGCSNTP